MNIIEATKKSLDTGGYIYRLKGHMKIILKPTFGNSCYIFYSIYSNTRKIFPRWNPDADDILSSDWQVISEAEFEDLLLHL